MTKPLGHIAKHCLNIIFVLVYFAIIIGLYNSCITVYDTVNNRNFANQYNPGEQQMHPEYSIYMKSANEIRLYFRFFPKELAYFVNENDSIPRAQAKLFFRVTNSYAATHIIDSLTTTLNLQGKPRSHYLGYVPLRLPTEGKYIIEVFLTDVALNKSVSSVIEYNYSFSGGASSYIFLSQYGNPLFYPYFSATDTFRVRSEMFSTKQLRVSYYKPITTLPIPPDIQKNILLKPIPADSSWIIENPDTTLFYYNKGGIYCFTSKNEIIGKPYSCFNEFYPYIKEENELLKPLAYLCSKKEMTEYYSYPSIKQAVDTFWIQPTNDLDKSRELIRIYYNRVQLANYYFTDYKEGWLTDRGMIYIICGAPAIIRKTDEGEYWVYGRGSNDATKFFFYRENHPLFGNTYILERSDLYSRMWYNAISTWRDGRIFSLNP